MKFLIALSLLVASPAFAEPVTSDEIIKVNELAKDVCPAAMETALRTQDFRGTASLVVDSARKAGMSSEQTVLLLNYCIAYQRGVMDGLKIGRAQ